MSIGIGLLKCLVENEIPITTLMEKGIDITYFETDREKDTYKFIKEFKAKYGKYPEIKTIDQECGVSIIQRLPQEPLDYWLEKIEERRKASVLVHLVKKLEQLIPEGEIAKGLKLLDSAYLDLKNIESAYKIRDLYELGEMALAEQCEIQASGEDVPGIPTGLPTLDELIGGMCGGDLLFILGETGVNKSYLTLYWGLNAYLNNYNVMFISPEMTEKQIGRRSLALQGRLPDRLLKKGQVYYYGVEKLKKVINNFKGRDNWFKILPSGMFTDIHSILEVALEYHPDLLIVDGVYLLKNSKIKTNTHWKEDESIIFLLKELALKENIPVLCTTQYSRSGKNKREGARGTQSVEQTASLLFSLEFEYEEDKEMAKPVTTRLLKIKKGRDGERMILRLRINFEKTEIVEEDIINAPSYILDNKEEAEDNEPVMEII